MRTNGTNLILPNAFSSTFPAGPITLQISSKSFSCFSGLAAKWWTRNAAVEAVESIPTYKRAFLDCREADSNEKKTGIYLSLLALELSCILANSKE